MDNSISNHSTFIDEDFLLRSKFAKELYHDFAKNQPIIDYHNHLPPDEIAENRKFSTISQVWLEGDHYKWRAMRTKGIDEKYITGKSTDLDKFIHWAETVPYTLRNPLYHWTHLELKRYFGIDTILNKDTALEIYGEANRQLSHGNHNVQDLLRMMNVEVVCTTDDPCDDLRFHQQYKPTKGTTEMYPAFRPDKAVFILAPNYRSYLEKLGQVADININSISTLKSALESRIDFFHQNHCRLCDHGLSYIPYADSTEQEVNQIFNRYLATNNITRVEAEKFSTAILLFLAKEYHQRGWVQQFHLGALRDTNSRMLAQLGSDTGWDSIGDFPQAQTMAKFFNQLDSQDQLAKTIIYNLNPRDNELFATMIGNYNDGSVAGKIQWGSAWWFLDQIDGMEKQINTLSNIGLISQFVGMLTDSRSFLSFPRHEYFRRLLCNIFGNDIKVGLLPRDMKLIGKIVEDICYQNAKNYFNFN